jgi:hypothetical protein
MTMDATTTTDTADDVVQPESSADPALRYLATKDPELAALIECGRSFVRCGFGCGFLAVASYQENDTTAALTQHPCPSRPAAGQDRQTGTRKASWTSLPERVFSLWGFLITAAVAAAVVMMATGKSLINL